jgi:ferric-dicitrate binding protein FerR (iron transport regulator)
MASCTRIEGIIQAYVDGELSSSDRVILEQHVSACSACAVLVQRHRRLSAELFEAFSDVRLARDLRQPVLENLPEMELLSADLVGVNRRAKRRAGRGSRVAPYLPAAAVAVVAVLGFMINYYWPAPIPESNPAGVIIQVLGQVTRVAPDSSDWTGAFINDLVAGGERFQTGAGSQLMVGMLGPTRLKVNAHTRFTIDDPRRVSLEAGEIWLDVGRDGRLFKVVTPDGTITVFGTAFAVRVDAHGTTVAVERGEVLVTSENRFTNLTEGQQVHIAQRGLGEPQPVDEGEDVARWARSLQSDHRAEGVFQKLLAAPAGRAEVAAKEVFLIERPAGGQRWAFTAINVYWENRAARQGHCSYDIYVYDDQMQPLFRQRIEGGTFDDRNTTSVTLPVPGAPIEGVRQLVVRLVPDHATGTLEPSNVTVSGTAQARTR